MYLNNSDKLWAGEKISTSDEGLAEHERGPDDESDCYNAASPPGAYLRRRVKVLPLGGAGRR
jgi:hypothetical protein